MPDNLMGEFEVVTDTRTEEASLRLLRISPGKEVRPHYHRKSTQVYVVLSGKVSIRLGEGVLHAEPLDKVEVPPMTVHGLSARAPSLVLSIAVPPLSLGDQITTNVRRSRQDKDSEPGYGGE